MKVKATGSRAEVMHGTARRTSGGLLKQHLKYNKRGKIVSKRASARAKKENRLVKAGYKTKKGVFSLKKKKIRSRRRSRIRKQRGGDKINMSLKPKTSRKVAYVLADYFVDQYWHSKNLTKKALGTKSDVDVIDIPILNIPNWSPLTIPASFIRSRGVRGSMSPAMKAAVESGDRARVDVTVTLVKKAIKVHLNRHRDEVKHWEAMMKEEEAERSAAAAAPKLQSNEDEEKKLSKEIVDLMTKKLGRRGPDSRTAVKLLERKRKRAEKYAISPPPNED